MAEKKTAGAFDVRSVIGALLAVYGVVLLLVFAFSGADDAHGRNVDHNDNLWAGIVLLVVGLVFLAWARLRPIVVETKPAEDADRKTPPPAH